MCMFKRNLVLLKWYLWNLGHEGNEDTILEAGSGKLFK